jgi:acetolactate decarboxylase
MSLQLSDGIGKQDLLAKVAEVVDVNYFAAVRLDGTFKEVRPRIVKRQHRPFPPLSKATANQEVTIFSDLPGTLTSFWVRAFFRSRRYATFI